MTKQQALRQFAAAVVAILLVTQGMVMYASLGGTSPVEPAAAGTGDQVWTTTVSGGVQGIAVDESAGEVYIGETSAHSVQSFDRADGSKNWEYNGHSNSLVDVAVDTSSGVVYSVAEDNELHAIDASDGSQLWTYTGHSSTPYGVAVDEESGMVFSGGNGQEVHAIDSDGNLQWNYSTGSGIRSMGIDESSGTVYSGDDAGTVHALAVSDGSQKWTQSLNSKDVHGIATDEESNTVFYSTNGGDYVFSLDGSDGTERWRHSAITTQGVSMHSDRGEVYAGSHGEYVALDEEDGSELWTYSDHTETGSNDIYSIGADESGGLIFSGDQEGDIHAVEAGRMYLDRDEQTLDIKVEDQDGGGGVSSARVEVFAVSYDEIDETGEDPIEDLEEEANQRLEDASDIVPDGWESQADSFDVESFASGDVDGQYAALYSKDTASPTSGTIFRDADLSQPDLTFEEGEEIYVTAWDTTDDGGVLERYDSFNRQMPGIVQSDETVVIEQLDKTGDVVTRIHPTTDRVHSADIRYEPNDGGDLHYEKVHLSAGYYKVYPESNENAHYYVQVGDPVSQLKKEIRSDIEEQKDQYTQQAQNLIDELEANRFERQTHYTNETGWVTVDVNDETLKTVGIQATKVSGEDMAALDSGKNITEQEQAVADQLENSTVTLYQPSDVETVTLPEDDPVTVEMRSYSWSMWGNNSIMDDRMEEWREMLEDDMLSSVNGTLNDRFAEFRDLQDSHLNRSDLEETYDRLDELSQQNEELRNQYERLWKRFEERQQNGTLGELDGANTTEAEKIVTDITLDINPGDASDEELRQRVAVLEQAMELTRGDTPVDSDTETGEDTISTTFEIDDAVPEEDIIVYANTRGGREVVDDEYITVDQAGLTGSTTVVEIEDYPVDSSDNNVATFSIRAVTSDSVAKETVPVQNPHSDMDLPTFDSVHFSEGYPAPGESATMEVRPGESETFGAVESARIHHPNGTTKSATVEDGTTTTFPTGNPGIYVAEMDLSPVGSNETVSERVRVRVDDSRSTPANVRVRQGKTGTFATTADGIERAAVDRSGEDIEITARAADGAKVHELRVHTTEMDLPPEARMDISVLKSNGESFDRNVRLNIHTQRLSDDATAYRIEDGSKQAIGMDEATEYGIVEERNGGVVIKTATDSSGSIAISTNNDPSIIDRVAYRVRLAGVPLPSLSLSIVPTLFGAASGLLTLGTFALFARSRRRAH